MNYQLIQQMNYPQQMNYSQIQNNQNYNDISQQLNNEKLKNKKLEEEIQRLKNKINELKNNNIICPSSWTKNTSCWFRICF